MHECVDGEYQTFRANDGAFLRKEFFGKYPELLKLCEHMSDDELESPPRRSGSGKVFNGYRRAMMTEGRRR
jgi:pyruvate dehydrogenase E1 component